MELGIFTFADYTADLKTGIKIAPEQRMKDLIEEIVLADKVGLDVFGIGEHHRPDYLVSAPIIPLSAGAALTKNIRLTSAVTVLSSDDPVRVFQQYSELDLLSNGRAEIMAGRGSFIESFPLFGYDLDEYDELFEEKLDLLLRIRENEKVNFVGRFRANIDNLGVYPRPKQNPLPIWIAVGGNPESVERAGRLGLPLSLAIIGGYPQQFAPLMEIYKKAAKDAGHDPKKLKISINSHGYIAEKREDAVEEYFPVFEHMMNKIGKERGWGMIDRKHYENEISEHGAVVLGTPEEVAEKILWEHALFGNSRFLLQISISTMPHDKVMSAIELLGTKVAPIVKKELKK